MKKHLFAIMVLLSVMTMTYAQIPAMNDEFSYGQPWKMALRETAPPVSSTPFKLPKRAITPVGNQFWWGYFSNSNADDLPYSGNLGYSRAVTVDAAIFIPANHPIVGVGTIKALRFWLGSDISKISSDVTAWISYDLPDIASAADFTQKIEKSKIVSRLNEVELTKPFSVKNNGFYAGFSFDISDKTYPVMSYGNEDVPNSFFFRVTGNEWVDFPSMGYGYGILALQLLVDGVSLPQYSVSATDFPTNYVLMDNQVYIPVTITNEGGETVNSVSYIIYTDGVAADEKTISVNNLESFGSTDIYIPFKADTQTRKYTKELKITKVNGQPNESSNNVAKGSLITISEKPVAVPVVEEFTGTWCGYCPYGIVGMSTAHEQFGDKVVLIAAHAGDVMAISDYDPILSKASSYPSSLVNRIDSPYPSSSTLVTYINRGLTRVTVGSIQASAMWTSDDKTGISIDTQTKFVYSDNNGKYGIAYVLIADGLKGTDSGWAQSNYLSGGGGDSSMSFWYNAGSKVTGLEFDHVAVGAWGIADGVSGSVNSKITAGEVQKYNYVVDITSKSLIQDKSKLTVAALLIDQSTGTIVNASQVAIQDYNPSINSKQFEFQYDGKNVDDTEIVIPAVEDEFGFGGLCCATNPISAPEKGLILKQLGSSGASGTATLTIEHNSLNASTIQWCMGGTCNIMKSNSITKTFVVDGSVQVQFDANDIKDKGYLLANLSVDIGGENHTVRIRFTNNIKGDINGDGSVNITDVVETINLIAAGSYSSAADLNADNAVNISDVVQIINIIAGL